MTPQESASAAPDYLHPPLECNLVMKGGITSGIVYPPAVLVLAPKYRFRQIGGASAGAIAAAITAAAECGRASDGFIRLTEVNEHLSKPANVLSLFQPDASTRPLFRVLLAFMSGPAPAAVGAGFGAKLGRWLGGLWGKLVLVAKVILTYVANDALVALPAIGLAAWLGASHPFREGRAWAIGTPLLAAIVAALLVALVRLGWILVRVVPRHDFGLCRGTSGEGARPPALTNWLDEQLDRIAGLAPGQGPLTIAQLQARDIDLRMMTTDLSIAEPAALPFEQRDLLFQADDMRRLFPKRIVDHLILKSHGDPHKDAAGLHRKGYYFLPLPGDLPVVFCARLSLSFPVLISAIPLYSIRYALRGKLPKADEEFDPKQLMQQHWFSDGGISSNFPVHFFSRWLPRRPTFGIDLTEMPNDAFAPAAPGAAGAVASGAPAEACMSLLPEYTGAGEVADAVVLPEPNRRLHPEWSPIVNLGDFLGSVWETTHSFRDNMLVQLPGFRERVVRIRFATGEGGLNLSMSAAAVASVRAKGQRAGELLDQKFNFDDHRWVHYLVMMAELEEGLNQIANTVRSDPGVLQKLLDHGQAPYPRTREWREAAVARTRQLAELVEQWRKDDLGPAPDPALSSELFRLEEPRPNPELRLSPRV